MTLPFSQGFAVRIDNLLFYNVLSEFWHFPQNKLLLQVRQCGNSWVHSRHKVCQRVLFDLWSTTWCFHCVCVPLWTSKIGWSFTSRWLHLFSWPQWSCSLKSMAQMCRPIDPGKPKSLNRIPHGVVFIYRVLLFWFFFSFYIDVCPFAVSCMDMLILCYFPVSSIDAW